MTNNQKVLIGNFQKQFLSFDINNIEKIADQFISADLTQQDFLDACMPCMEEIGNKFETGEYFLPQLVVAGEMFKKVNSRFEKGNQEIKTFDASDHIVLGTPTGDIHDLGKNIFSVLAQANGFAVHDLGVDVPPEAFIKKLKETGANILGMSSLLTSTFDAIQKVVKLLEDNNLRDKTFILIGGGGTEQSLIEKFNIDAQTRDANEGIRILKEYIKTRNKEMTA